MKSSVGTNSDTEGISIKPLFIKTHKPIPNKKDDQSRLFQFQTKLLLSTVGSLAQPNVYRVTIKYVLTLDVFNCSPLLTMPSWQYIDLIENLVDIREIPCVAPSEEQAARGFRRALFC